MWFIMMLSMIIPGIVNHDESRVGHAMCVFMGTQPCVIKILILHVLNDILALRGSGAYFD